MPLRLCDGADLAHSTRLGLRSLLVIVGVERFGPVLRAARRRSPPIIHRSSPPIAMPRRVDHRPPSLSLSSRVGLPLICKSLSLGSLRSAHTARAYNRSQRSLFTRPSIITFLFSSLPLFLWSLSSYRTYQTKSLICIGPNFFRFRSAQTELLF